MQIQQKDGWYLLHQESKLILFLLPYNIEFLVVAGGGASAADLCGGGGAGGFRTSSQSSVMETQ